MGNLYEWNYTACTLLGVGGAAGFCSLGIIIVFRKFPSKILLIKCAAKCIRDIGIKFSRIFFSGFKTRLTLTSQNESGSILSCLILQKKFV